MYTIMAFHTGKIIFLLIIIGSVLLLSSMEDIEGFVSNKRKINKKHIEHIEKELMVTEPQYKKHIENIKKTFLKFSKSIKGPKHVTDSINQNEKQIIQMFDQMHNIPNLILQPIKMGIITRFDHKVLKELIHHMSVFAKETELLANKVIDGIK